MDSTENFSGLNCLKIERRDAKEISHLVVFLCAPPLTINQSTSSIFTPPVSTRSSSSSHFSFQVKAFELPLSRPRV
jgi:hypothetical protein